MRFKLRVDACDGVHIHASLFVGAGSTLANAGKLCLLQPEFNVLSAMLLLGARASGGVDDVELDLRKLAEARMNPGHTGN